MNQFAHRLVVALAICLVIAQSVALAQNLGAAPQVNVAVQGQTGAQPEGAFLNFVNWVGNVIAPVGAGVAVLGVSPDKSENHVKFRTKYKLKFPLLTDADKKVMQKYGAWGEKTMYGKKTVGTIRSTFLVGPNGKVQRAWYHVKADGHAAKVLEEVNEK